MESENIIEPSIDPPNMNEMYRQALDEWRANQQSFNYQNQNSPSLREHIIAILIIVAVICCYFGYVWSACICLVMSLLVCAANNDQFQDVQPMPSRQSGLTDLAQSFFSNLREELRIFYREATAPQRVRRSLQHVRNKDRKRYRNGSNIRRVSRADKYRNKVKSKKLKTGKRYQKY
eukprot:UN12546